MSTAAGPTGPNDRDREPVAADRDVYEVRDRDVREPDVREVREPEVREVREPDVRDDRQLRNDRPVHDGNRTPAVDPIARERARFGGMHFFLAFFGWLTATGMVVLLSAVLSAVLAAAGVQNQASNATKGSGLQLAAVIGIASLAAILFIGYYCGGYVAGRMARFNGTRQGLAVWLWAVIIAILVAVAGGVLGSIVGAFSQLNSAGLPISSASAGPIGIASAIVAVVFSLLGALLGGRGGERFHRKVDRVGFGAGA